MGQRLCPKCVHFQRRWEYARFLLIQRGLRTNTCRVRCAVELKPGVEWVDMHLEAERAILAALKAGGLLQGSVDDMMVRRTSHTMTTRCKPEWMACARVREASWHK